MKSQLLDIAFVALILLNWFTLGTSRIRAAIHVVAIQGVVLGLLPLLVHEHVPFRVLVLAGAIVALKGVVLPKMMFWAMRDLSIRREVEPLISLTSTLILGAVGTALCLGFASSLPLIEQHGRNLLVPASLSTVLTGFLILSTRTKAITQVLGYLALENGIFIFGLLLIETMPILVELGVLLDLFVAVLVMGIVVHHISREFRLSGAERLAELRD